MTSEISDKNAISEVIYQYCRGMDRMDRALTLSCWHPGGTDDHAPLYYGSAEGFIDWLWPVHAAMVGTRHCVSNILIELNGDKAASESYWNVQLRIERDGDTYDLLGAGRYIDEFELIDGVWAIRHRVSIGDLTNVVKVEADIASFDPPLIIPNNPERERKMSARSELDYSYAALASLAK